jgi:hypothetical protein
LSTLSVLVISMVLMSAAVSSCPGGACAQNKEGHPKYTGHSQYCRYSMVAGSTEIKPTEKPHSRTQSTRPHTHPPPLRHAAHDGDARGQHAHDHHHARARNQHDLRGAGRRAGQQRSCYFARRHARHPTARDCSCAHASQSHSSAIANGAARGPAREGRGAHLPLRQRVVPAVVAALKVVRAARHRKQVHARLGPDVAHVRIEHVGRAGRGARAVLRAGRCDRVTV